MRKDMLLANFWLLQEVSLQYKKMKDTMKTTSIVKAISEVNMILKLFRSTLYKVSEQSGIICEANRLKFSE